MFKRIKVSSLKETKKGLVPVSCYWFAHKSKGRHVLVRLLGATALPELASFQKSARRCFPWEGLWTLEPNQGGSRSPGPSCLLAAISLAKACTFSATPSSAAREENITLVSRRDASGSSQRARCLARGLCSASVSHAVIMSGRLLCFPRRILCHPFFPIPILVKATFIPHPITTLLNPPTHNESPFTHRNQIWSLPSVSPSQVL